MYCTLFETLPENCLHPACRSKRGKSRKTAEGDLPACYIDETNSIEYKAHLTKNVTSSPVQWSSDQLQYIMEIQKWSWSYIVYIIMYRVEFLHVIYIYIYIFESSCCSTVLVYVYQYQSSLTYHKVNVNWYCNGSIKHDLTSLQATTSNGGLWSDPLWQARQPKKLKIMFIQESYETLR